MVEREVPGQKQTEEEKQRRGVEFPFYAAGGCGTQFMEGFLQMTDAEVEQLHQETKIKLKSLTPKELKRGQQLLEEMISEDFTHHG